MKAGDVITWTSDGDGRPETTVLAQVISLTDRRIKLRVKDGTEVNVLLTDGTFTPSTEEFKLEVPAPRTKKSSRKKKAPATGSKTERALEVMKSMPTGTRGEIIKAFVDKVGLTPAGAATYYTNCRKALSK